MTSILTTTFSYVHFGNVKDCQQAVRKLNKNARRAYMVEGTPFVEDLTSRIPSQVLEVKFSDTMLTQEEIFAMMRKYGKLKDISAFEDKKLYRVHFKHISDANAARNCLDGKVLKDSVMDINSIPVSWKIPIDLLTSPRAIVPIAGATVGAITLLLNPIRMYFVTQKLTIEKGVDFLADYSGNYVMNNVTDTENRLREYIQNRPTNVLLVFGPKGSDKTTLFKKISQRRMFSARIDCEKISSSQDFIDQFVHDVGFRPSFAALNTLFAWFSSFIPNAMTQSSDAQLSSLLKCLDRVLLLPTTTNHSPLIVFDEFDKFLKLLESDSKDEVKRASHILDLLGNWALTATRAGKAHIVFVSNNAYAEDIFRKIDGFKSMTIINIKDVSTESAETYLKSRFTEIHGGKIDHLDRPIKNAVKLLGGRLGDLDQLIFLSSKSISIDDTLQMMVDDAIKNIRKRGFGNHIFGGSSGNLSWPAAGFWRTVKLFKDKDVVDYDIVLVTIFDGDDRAIRAIVEQNLLKVDISPEGKRTIRPFSPLYLAAYRIILNDNKMLYYGMEKMCKQIEIDKETAFLEKVENELAKLSKVLSTSAGTMDTIGISSRMRHLNERLYMSAKKLDQKRKEMDSILDAIAYESTGKKAVSEPGYANSCNIL